MRLRVVKIIYFSFIFLIIARLWYWQIVRADDLSAKGDDQRLSESDVLAPRGQILFSDNSTLVSNQPSFLVFAQPKIIKNKDAVAKELAEVFFSLEDQPNLDGQAKKDRLNQLKSDFLEKLNKDLFWVSLGRTVDLRTKQIIENLNFNGIGFDSSFIRFYPEGSSSAHLLGFVSSDSYGSPTGYFGLEGFYNGELKGKNGTLLQEKDARGLPILIGKFQSQEPKPGKTLKLNIDRAVQHIVEQKLLEGMEQFGALQASAIVMDPKTGAILALANYPNYNPPKVSKYPKDYYQDPAIAEGYEPGSTFKVLVMASALNEHLLTPETVCDSCSGPVSVGGYDIHTWNNQYQPHLTMADTIIHSDNTGMVFVSKKLGIDKMYNYLKKFGVGDLTGVDLQDESSPDLRQLKDWHEIDLATASFGQGISLTALQVVRAIGALANGGKLMEPHVVSQIIDNGSTYNVLPRVVGQPISAEAAKQVTDMMVAAVDKGEAQFYKKHEGVGSFKIAGKTGTAQIPVAGHYDPTKTIASFVGFAPADDPKFVMIVRYNQPTALIYGAETAAPTFFQIAKELFTYYGIAPSKY